MYKVKEAPEPGDVIVVWFSSGAASAIALQETIRKYGWYCVVRAVNNPIAEEDPDNRRFLNDCSKQFGIEIERHTNPKFPAASCVQVWEKKKFMSSPYGAPCTDELKKKARQDWEAKNKHDWLVMGFTADEKERSANFAKTERENLLPVLVDEGITKAECFVRLKLQGIEVPSVYKRGYPNGNCIGCVKATSPTYWNHVRVQDPEIFRQRAEQSRRIGAKLVRVKGERMYLDELPPDAKGRPMKDMHVECNGFCGEP